MKFFYIMKTMKFKIKRCIRRFLSIFPCVNKHPQRNSEKKVDPKECLPGFEDIECPKLKSDKLDLDKLDLDKLESDKLDLDKLESDKLDSEFIYVYYPKIE